MDQTGHARGRRGHAEVAADERPIAQLLCGRCQQYACSLTTVCDRGLSTRVRAIHCLGLISRSTYAVGSVVRYVNNHFCILAVCDVSVNVSNSLASIVSALNNTVPPHPPQRL